MTVHQIHYFKTFENYEFIGWSWKCNCGAHSRAPQATNKIAAKRGWDHLNRKHLKEEQPCPLT